MSLAIIYLSRITAALWEASKRCPAPHPGGLVLVHQLTGGLRISPGLVARVTEVIDLLIESVGSIIRVAGVIDFNGPLAECWID